MSTVSSDIYEILSLLIQDLAAQEKQVDEKYLACLRVMNDLAFDKGIHVSGKTWDRVNNRNREQRHAFKLVRKLLASLQAKLPSDDLESTALLDRLTEEVLES